MTKESPGNMLDDLKPKLPEMRAEYDEVHKKLSQFLEANDKSEVIAQFLTMSAFAPEDNPSFNSEYRESSPMIHCLVGLALNSDQETSDEFDASQFMPFVEDIKTLIAKHHFLMMVESNRTTAADDVAHTARLQSIMNQMNFHAYQFQIDRLLEEVYRPFDEFFLKKFGFTVVTAVKAAKAIRELYEHRVNERKTESQKFVAEIRNDSEANMKAEAQAKEYQCSVEDIFIGWGVQVHFFRLRECFLFTSEQLSNFAGTSEDQTGAFLRFFSSKYGDNGNGYRNLESQNAILKKPCPS